MSLYYWLNKPYPQITSTRLKLAICFGIGIVCFLFLARFRPFGLDEVDNITFISGFGLSATLGLLISYFVLPLIFPKYFNHHDWTIGKEIVFFAIVHLFIASFNFLYNNYLGRNISPQYDFFSFIGFTLSVGILPTLIIVYITERVERSKHLYESSIINKELNSTHSESSINSSSIKIFSENQSEEDLVLDPDKLIYIAASNNYCTIYYLENSTLLKRVIRVSMKSLTQQLSSHNCFYRCHKSYIINSEKIIKTSGNARSLYVELEYVSSLVPVSRSFDKSLLCR